jgi:hypothetical protein
MSYEWRRNRAMRLILGLMELEADYLYEREEGEILAAEAKYESMKRYFAELKKCGIEAYTVEDAKMAFKRIYGGTGERETGRVRA